jgi:hypothetical protein
MSIKRRVEALEAAGPAVVVRWHRILVDVGGTIDRALDAYGRDRIAPTDCLVIRRVVDPAAIGGRN